MGLGGEAQKIVKECNKPKDDSEALLTYIFIIMPIEIFLMMFVTYIAVNCIFDIKYTEVFVMNLFPCDLGICIVYILAGISSILYDHLSGYFSPRWPMIVIPIGVILLGILIIVLSGYWDSQMQLHREYMNHLSLKMLQR